MLRPKQKKFADKYLKTGNGTASATGVYDTDNENSLAVIASQNLRKLKIQNYIEDRAEKSAENVVELGNQRENLSVALGANKDILDRAGFKPVEKSQNLNVNVDIDVLEPKAKALKDEYEAKIRAIL